VVDATEEEQMEPQDYSARTAHRPPANWYRRLNWLGVLLTSLGLAPRDAVVLEVRGRTTGKVRRIPILQTRYRDEDYLVSLSGESSWVRNVRAAYGDAAIRRLGAARPVILHELEPEKRVPVIDAYLRAASERSGAAAAKRQAHHYFGLDDTSPGEIERIVDYYPVFRIDDPVRVAEAGPADAGAFAEFLRAAWREAGPDAPGFAGATDDVIAELATPVAFRERIGGPDRRMFLAWRLREVVGFAATRRVSADTVELSGIVVRRSCAGRGIGTALLDSAMDAARRHGYRRMIVETETSNVPAKAFYEARGFAVGDVQTEQVGDIAVEVWRLSRSV
jgi:ribosomal protein S18 acetylase RimI-like enzyme